MQCRIFIRAYFEHFGFSDWVEYYVNDLLPSYKDLQIRIEWKKQEE